MMCRAERNVALRQAARAYLAARGCIVKPKSAKDPVAGWTVPGYLGAFDHAQLIAFAESCGFDAGAAHG